MKSSVYALLLLIPVVAAFYGAGATFFLTRKFINHLSPVLAKESTEPNAIVVHSFFTMLVEIILAAAATGASLGALAVIILRI